MRQYLIIFFLLSLYGLRLDAQEFNVSVNVIAPRTQIADPKIFRTLEDQVRKFINNTKWTEDEYEDFEKIEGNINISITEELSTNSFKADINLQSLRPVYNSNYKTATINFNDRDVTFSYVEFQPFQNSFSSYNDPLSSLFTYYAYLMLGYEYDSFEMYAGDKHFKTAQQIINQIPSNIRGGSGWDVNVKNNRSRVSMITDLLDPRARPFRQAMYDYHIKSLDNMHNDPGKSKAIMTSAITAIDQVNSSMYNSGIVQVFTDTKRQEIVEVFKGAGKGDQTKIFQMMMNMDPARASDYDAIK